MEYTNFVENDDCPFDSTPVRASLLKINELMSSGLLSSPMWRPHDVKMGKIIHYENIIDQAGPIPRPAFRLRGPRGLFIMSGRHRCYALLDAGYSIIEICTLPEFAEQMHKLVGSVTEQQ